MGIGNVLSLINNAQLNDIANYLSTPIATYTHNSNKETYVSAVDVNTDTFTSVGHTLFNGDKVYPIMNYNAGNIFVLDKYPGGIGYTSGGYFVVNKTANTFQLSLTSGGSAIDLTVNANLDLTKWHFETFNDALTISNLPSMQKCNVHVKGRCMRSGNSGYILPSTISAGNPEFMVNGISGFVNSGLAMIGDVSIDLKVEIDYSGYLTLKEYGIGVSSLTISTLSASLLQKFMVSPKYINGIFTAINISIGYFANGTIVEVFKA